MFIYPRLFSCALIIKPLSIHGHAARRRATHMHTTVYTLTNCVVTLAASMRGHVTPSQQEREALLETLLLDPFGNETGGEHDDWRCRRPE